MPHPPARRQGVTETQKNSVRQCFSGNPSVELNCWLSKATFAQKLERHVTIAGDTTGSKMGEGKISHKIF